MEKLLRNFNSDSDDESMLSATDGNTSSAERLGPTKEERRTWRWTPEKSCDESPLMESTVKKKPNLVPGGTCPGTGEEERVEEDDPFKYLAERTTFTTLMSTRHEPMASAVYRQKIGTVDVDDNLRESGASEIRAFPIKEYSGGGESKNGSSDENCCVYEGRSI